MKLMFEEPKMDGKQGLFVEYLNQKANEYQAPTREGTARGDKIGFPLKKYVACLLVGLTNYKLKKIAELWGSGLGFSYGLLRKWNCESDFKVQQEHFQKEFAWKIFNYIQSEFEKSWKTYNDYYDARSNKKPVDVNYKIIGRYAKRFNPSVLHKLEGINIDHFEKIVELNENNKISANKYLVESAQYFSISDFILYGLGRKIRKDDDIQKKFLKLMVSDSIDLLSKKRNLSIKDQRKILGLLELVMEFISRR
jgi:hypothetical protein